MLTVDATIAASCPGMQMGILALHDVHPPYDQAGALQIERAALDRIQETYGQHDRDSLKALSPIDAYVRYYRQFGANYHLLAQLESVLRGKPLRAPTPLLRLMFLSEIEHMLLTAGHDLLQVQFPLTLRSATGQEVYTAISGKDVACVAGDAILCDDAGPISSIMRGPDRRTRIGEATTDLLFVIYAPAGVGTEALTRGLDALESRIALLAPSTRVEHQQVYPLE